MDSYYSDEWVTIFHGDAEQTMAQFGADEFDITVTSPPYNMGLQPGGNGRGMYRPAASRKSGRFRDGYSGDNDDARPYDEYCAWQRDVLAECWRVSARAVFYNHRPRVEHGTLRFPIDGDYGDLNLRQIITWDRGTGIDVNLRSFCTRGEWIMLFTKPDFTLVDHAASGMGDVWRMGIVTGNDHPAPFPVGLPARCIAATGARSVIDPFMGSGTTLRAAKDAGIRGVGIEINERYCEMAVARLAQESLALE